MNATINNPLRIAFAGTPEFSVPALQFLISEPSVDLVAVYTQPDRRAGRGRALKPSPIKMMATKHSLPVYQPENFRDEQTITAFSELAVDVLVVVAYGLILPERLLRLVRYPINIHASLLPRWRGAAPIQRAIMAGDEQTGITIMRVVKALDAGPMWNRRTCPIESDETYGQLHDKLAGLGADALGDALKAILTDAVAEEQQDDGLSNYADKIEAVDRLIDWSRPAVELDRQIRGLNPSPIAIANAKGEAFKIWQAQVEMVAHERSPGEIIDVNREGLAVATGEHILRITTIQPPGKKAMSATDFANGAGRELRRFD